MDYLIKKINSWPKSDISSRMEIRAKIWVFLLQKSSFCQKTPKPYYIDLNINAGEHFWWKKFGPMGPLGVPRVPISGPNRGIFSKLIGPGPLGSGGHSHTSFSNGRFRDTYTSFHIDVVMRIEITESNQNQKDYIIECRYLARMPDDFPMTKKIY